MSNEKIIEDLTKDIQFLKQEVARLGLLVPLYEVGSRNVPAILTADQNDYVIGNYDILELTSNASRTITGFAGGVTGRFLTLLNGGSNNIVLANGSASSIAINRIFTPGGASLTMSPFSGTGNGRAVQLFHSGTSWIVTFRSVP